MRKRVGDCIFAQCEVAAVCMTVVDEGEEGGARLLDFDMRKDGIGME
jgi:hypothetical protein